MTLQRAQLLSAQLRWLFYWFLLEFQFFSYCISWHQRDRGWEKSRRFDRSIFRSNLICCELRSCKIAGRIVILLAVSTPHYLVSLADSISMCRLLLFAVKLNNWRREEKKVISWNWNGFFHSFTLSTTPPRSTRTNVRFDGGAQDNRRNTDFDIDEFSLIFILSLHSMFQLFNLIIFFYLEW